MRAISDLMHKPCINAPPPKEPCLPPAASQAEICDVCDDKKRRKREGGRKQEGQIYKQEKEDPSGVIEEKVTLFFLWWERQIKGPSLTVQKVLCKLITSCCDSFLLPPFLASSFQIQSPFHWPNAFQDILACLRLFSEVFVTKIA